MERKKERERCRTYKEEGCQKRRKSVRKREYEIQREREREKAKDEKWKTEKRLKKGA